MVSHITARTPTTARAALHPACVPANCFPLVDIHFDGAAHATIAGLIQAGNAKRVSALETAVAANLTVDDSSSNCNCDAPADPTIGVDAEYALALLKARRKLQQTLQHKLHSLQALRLKSACMQRKRACPNSRRKTRAPAAAPVRCAPAAVAGAERFGDAKTTVWQGPLPVHAAVMDPPVIDRSMCSSPVSSDNCDDDTMPRIDVRQRFDPRNERRVEEEISFKQCAIYSA